MTYSESGHERSEPASKDLPELKCELAEIDDERFALCKRVENQWPNIPPEAISYLTKSCQRPELMSPVVNRLHDLPENEIQLLSDPDLMPHLIDDIIAEAESDYVGVQQRETDTETVGLTSTKQVLNAITSKTANLKGRAKLTAARNYLSNPDISDAVREEITTRFDHIEATLASMSVVLIDPENRSEFDRIISSASFDLSAPNLATTFAPILEQVEASETFTAEEKFILREIVTGSDAKNSLTETVTDENGNPVPRFTERNKREFRQGVSGYVEGHGRQIIEAHAGDCKITTDVTGWPGSDVGLLIEATHMWNMYDSFGVTGFIEDVYKIDFSILDQGSAFDPLQITHLRQVLSHLTGSFEGYDGDIANLSDHKTLIQNQARLLSETQTAMGFENDRSGTRRVLRRLALEDEKGQPNMERIKAFGDYSKEQFASGKPDQESLLAYLNQRSPLN
ncbi:MAG: hypothetical protein ACPGVT_07805 [Maricaulaceae bacterium]